MAISSITDMLERVESPSLLALLTKSLITHQQLEQEISSLLLEYGEKPEEPAIMGKLMSKAKVNIKMLEKNDDKTIAGLILDGCNMGIKQLCSLVNEYKAAHEKAVSLGKKLIKEEEHLIDELKAYL